MNLNFFNINVTFFTNKHNISIITLGLYDDGRVDEFVDLDSWMTQEDINDLFQQEQEGEIGGATTDTPGFELILLTIVILLFIFWKKRRK